MLEHGGKKAYVYANSTDEYVCQVGREDLKNPAKKLKRAACLLGINESTFSAHSCHRSKHEYVLYKRGIKECQKIREHHQKYGKQFRENGTLPYLDLYEESSGLLIQAINMVTHDYGLHSRGLSAMNSLSLYQGASPIDNSSSSSSATKSTTVTVITALHSSLAPAVCKDVMLQLARDFPTEKRFERYAFIERFEGDIGKIYDYYKEKKILPKITAASDSFLQKNIKKENTCEGSTVEPQVTENMPNQATSSSKGKTKLTLPSAHYTHSRSTKKEEDAHNIAVVLEVIMNDILSLYQPMPHKNLHQTSTSSDPLQLSIENRNNTTASLEKRPSLHQRLTASILSGDLEAITA